MSLAVIAILFCLLGSATWVIRTGRWRLALVPFRVNPRTMTWQHQGLCVHDPESRRRVNAILESFVQAFNVMIASRRELDWQNYCESRAPLLRAFAEEGVAMGYRLRSPGAFDPSEFESCLVSSRPAFIYLHYVGLGFWSGMRKHTEARLARRAAGLDPLHRYLCYDGYGFQRAFFALPRNPAALDSLVRLSGYAANAAYQGVGRALWFRYMDDSAGMINAIAALGDFAADAAAGAGLAATFVNPDRLHLPMELAKKLPAEWRPHFQLGMCFACKARSLNDPEWFTAELALAPRRQREAIRTSIAVCDRIEQEIRQEKPLEPYGEWRKRMTAWLEAHVEFPISGLKAQLLPGHGASAYAMAPMAIKHHDGENENG